MKGTDTPTYKALGKAILSLHDEIVMEAQGSTAPLNFSRMRDIAETICLLVEDEELRQVALGGFIAGIAKLEEVAGENPECREGIAIGTQTLLVSMWEVAMDVASRRMRSELTRMAPIFGKNEQKEIVIKFAKETARKFWAHDTHQQLRSTTMADLVYRYLVEVGLADHLPGSHERLKEWIKSEAPGYATAGGRPKKSPKAYR
ncbi:hypothetical protein QU926_13580 [Pseudomonas asiatica]|uniref:hypothetical protein n=1 Tax=Pseudomonas asiatica TaxID=2219225 RepID=UPI0025AA61A4|nr:hypothetical protein [Pseudomonas asiatica]MDM9554678.1 hypothetical protein [Pseudomonas asiatica]